MALKAIVDFAIVALIAFAVYFFFINANYTIGFTFLVLALIVSVSRKAIYDFL